MDGSVGDVRGDCIIVVAMMSANNGGDSSCDEWLMLVVVLVVGRWVKLRVVVIMNYGGGITC